MAWCDEGGLHPEIPASHKAHDHDHHDGTSAHERVDLEMVLLHQGAGAPAPIVARGTPPSPPRGPVEGVMRRAELRADPPGRHSPVRLL